MKLNLIFLSMITASSLAHSDAPYLKNLLKNPSAELNDFTGWTLTENPTGWGISANKKFLTSHSWSKREQTVNLLSKGFTEEQLDRSPAIVISEEFSSYYCDGDQFFLNVELLDSNMNTIAEYQTGERTFFGVQDSGACSYDKELSELITYEFKNYPSGVRYVRWRDGGKDVENWLGFYGTQLSNAELKIIGRNIEDVPFSSARGKNGVFMDLGSDKSVLSQEEWYHIQTYVEGGLRLPISEQAMKTIFRIPDDSNSFSFNQAFDGLLKGFNNIHSDADFWNRFFYPNVVQLAIDLANYSEIHRAYMKPIFDGLYCLGRIELGQEEKPICEAGEDYASTVLTLVDVLYNFSDIQANRSADVSQDLINISANLKLRIGELDIEEKRLHKEIGLSQTNIDSITREISELENEKQRLIKKHTDLTIAASTAGGATLLFPPAFIFTAPVAIGTGTAAALAQKELNDKMDEITQKSSELDFKRSIISAFRSIIHTVDNFHEKADGIQTSIERIKTHWQGIKSDLDQIKVLASTSQGNIFLTEINYRLIDQNWKSIGVAATQFSQNAYIPKARLIEEFQPYFVIAKHSNKALDVANFGKADGDNIQQWSLNGTENQVWALSQDSDGYFDLESRNSGLFMGLSGGSLTDGANIIQWHWNSDLVDDNLKWSIDHVDGEFFVIKSKVSGKCLDVAGGTSAIQDGANIQQWDCSRSDNQLFKFVKK